MTTTMIEAVYGSTTAGLRQDLAVSVKPTRIIFVCKNKNCKHIWAHDYRKIYRVMPETIWPRTGGKPYRIEAVYEYTRIDEQGKSISHEMDYDCPKCGRHGQSNVVVGTYSEQHKCDARCMGAKNGACECSCGGANHGINHL